MAVKVEMPKLSDTMEEGVIAKWNVKEGDRVQSGDIIAEVETDKATMEVEVFDEGTILKILVEEGAAVPLGKTMAVIGEEGEDISEFLQENGEDTGTGDREPGEDEDEKSAAAGKDSGKEEKKKQPEKSAGAGEDSTGDGRIKASPLARKMAEEQGINLSDVEGSGPEGRIVRKDIEEYQPSAAPSAAVSREDREHRVSQMRKTIARRLAESKYSSPHYYETIDIDMERTFEARRHLNETTGEKISFNDIIVKACGAALRNHPGINSSWQGDTILEHGDVHVAVAVAIDEGLVTPVIRNTDQKGLLQISAETKELAEKARNRNLQAEEMEGSTFTVSNLGMFGIEQFTAIINPPNACILAVGAIREEPVVKDGEIVVGRRMKVTLSSDHRIVDGAMAARFLHTLKGMLENPLGMLI